jgi:hypothetical protein
MGICSGRSELHESSSNTDDNVHLDEDELFSVMMSAKKHSSGSYSVRARHSREVHSELELTWKLTIENPSVEVEVLPTPIVSISQNVCSESVLPEYLLNTFSIKRPNRNRNLSFSISRSTTRAPLRAHFLSGSGTHTPNRVYPSQTTSTSSPETPVKFEVESQPEHNFFPCKSNMFFAGLIEERLVPQKMSSQAHTFRHKSQENKEFEISLKLHPSSGSSNESMIKNTENDRANSHTLRIRTSIDRVTKEDYRSKEEYLRDLNQITCLDLKHVTEKYLRQSGQIQLNDFWAIIKILKISIRSFDLLLEGYIEGIEMRRSKKGWEDITCLDYESFVHALHCVEPRLKCDWDDQLIRSRSGSFTPSTYEMSNEKILRIIGVLRTSRSSPWSRREALIAIPRLLKSFYFEKVETSGSLSARANILQNIQTGIYIQLTGAKSCFVIRQACLTVSEISTICSTADMGLVMRGLLACLSAIWKPVILNSALFSAEVLIASNVNTLSLLCAVIEGCSDTLISVQISCLKLLAECCNTGFAKKQPTDSEFWKKVVHSLQAALVRSKAGIEHDFWLNWIEQADEQSKLVYQQEFIDSLNCTLDSVARSSSIGSEHVKKIKSSVASIKSYRTVTPVLRGIPFESTQYCTGRGFNRFLTMPVSRDMAFFPEGKEVSPHNGYIRNSNLLRDFVSRKSNSSKLKPPLFRFLSPESPGHISEGEPSYSSDDSSLNQDIVDVPFQIQTPPESCHSNPRLSKKFDLDDRSVVTLKGLGHHTRQRSLITSDADDRSIITLNDHYCSKVGLSRLDQERLPRVTWDSKKLQKFSLSEPMLYHTDTFSSIGFYSQSLKNEVDRKSNIANITGMGISAVLVKPTQRDSDLATLRRVSLSQSTSKPSSEQKTSHDVTKISLGEMSHPSLNDLLVNDSKSAITVSEPVRTGRITKSTKDVITKFQELLTTTTKSDLTREWKRISTEQQLNYRDFCLLAVEQFKLPWSVDKCKKTFKKFDNGNKKFISAEDFEMMFHKAEVGIEEFWFHILRPDEISIDKDEEITSVIADEEVCYELLKCKGDDWKRRIRALEGLQAIVSEIDDSKFEHFMLKFKNCLKLQIQDRRSQVSKAACDVTARMVEASPEQFFPHTPFILKALYEVVAMKAIKVTRQCANDCCIRIFHAVSDKNQKRLLLRSIISASVKPHGSVRESAYEHLKIYIENLAKGVSPTSEESMDEIEELLKKGIADRLPSVRTNALLALEDFTEIDQERFQRVFQSMSSAVQKKFAKQIGRPDLVPNVRKNLAGNRRFVKHPRSKTTHS